MDDNNIMAGSVSDNYQILSVKTLAELKEKLNAITDGSFVKVNGKEFYKLDPLQDPVFKVIHDDYDEEEVKEEYSPLWVIDKGLVRTYYIDDLNKLYLSELQVNDVIGIGGYYYEVVYKFSGTLDELVEEFKYLADYDDLKRLVAKFKRTNYVKYLFRLKNKLKEDLGCFYYLPGGLIDEWRHFKWLIKFYDEDEGEDENEEDEDNGTEVIAYAVQLEEVLEYEDPFQWDCLEAELNLI